MAQFEMVLSALTQGRSVRLPKWDAMARISVSDGMLMIQRGSAKPYIYDLSWEEIIANDWQLLEAAVEA